MVACCLQLMPVTANYMAHDTPLDHSKLDDPKVNLELGQRYVLYLARHDAVDDDLIRLLASYNAGPGKCATWNIRDDGDPLLFIEAIPIEQTRVFVQRALAYTWIYAGRLNLPAPSLDELAAMDDGQLAELGLTREQVDAALAEAEAAGDLGADPNNPEHHYGLTTVNHAPKPALSIFKSLAATTSLVNA